MRDVRITSNVDHQKKEVLTFITAANSEEAGPLVQELATTDLNRVAWSHCTYQEPAKLLMAEGDSPDGWAYRLFVMNADLRYVAEDDERRPVCHLAAIIAVLGFDDYRSICNILRNPATYRTFIHNS